jgi:hypothetical protein
VNELGFEYQRSLSPIFGGGTTSAGTGDHTYVGGLEHGRTYYFRVRAYNDAGVSAWSNVVSVYVPTVGGVVTGTVFEDANGDGVKQSSESGVYGALVYADLNNNLKHDADEPYSITGFNGNYLVDGLGAGGVFIRVNLPSTYVPASDQTAWGASLNLSAGQRIDGVMFGAKKKVV